VAGLWVWLSLGAIAQDTVTAIPLQNMIDAKGEIWKIDRDSFIREHAKLGFAWVSGTTNDVAVMHGRAVSFLDLPVAEAIARFHEKGLKELTLFIYNRGDSGDIEIGKFDNMVKVAQDRLTEWTGAKATTVSDSLKTIGVKKDARVWTKAPHQFKLEWSYSTGTKGKDFGGLRPEYLRLRCQALDPSRDYRSELLTTSASRGRSVSLSGLKANVTTNGTGDVYIKGIPMVDQGQKGYCAAATTERIMRYYGRDMDQHELAQMAQTSANMGTDPRTLVEVLRKLGIALGYKVQIHEDFTVQSFIKMIEKYNKLAKDKGKAEITYGQAIDINAVYQAMDTEVLKELRGKQKGDIKSFQACIEKYVKQGIPLVWSVIIGKVVEDPPLQGAGGHMRMIIGYNNKTSEFLYTDTWGPGHELKRMAAADVWLITVGLYTIEPTKTTM